MATHLGQCERDALQDSHHIHRGSGRQQGFNCILPPEGFDKAGPDAVLEGFRGLCQEGQEPCVCAGVHTCGHLLALVPGVSSWFYFSDPDAAHFCVSKEPGTSGDANACVIHQCKMCQVGETDEHKALCAAMKERGGRSGKLVTMEVEKEKGAFQEATVCKAFFPTETEGEEGRYRAVVANRDCSPNVLKE
ncbi:unnamed protein product [Vitrella brassicaformis CCMP3155]|uniref:Uncharacterized protein n=1 Tax=Vitrella brassicaformis (strain CCMP3155) TaxID=1169540 RepID=A0A0G4FHS9_VITBC|nr:unnamed protein product [Vitrella brassicaformis CCMP3155]|eukprot:CEM12997.1 unnamed protein product [Vitrella brassicaformis CCMP3155]